jgi:hypothetical protein
MKKKYFSAFFLFFDSKCTAKQTKTDTLQEVVITVVGLICLSKKIPEPFS